MPPGNVEPIIEVSWDGSGAFSGPYDDVTADTLANPGVTIETGRDGARAFHPPMVPAADFDLNNEHGTYSQLRSDSPIYQQVLTGRPVRVSAAFGQTRLYRSHITYQAHVPYRGRAIQRLATTSIDAIDQTAGIGSRRVRLSTLGLLGKLTGQRVSVPVQALFRTDNAITALLDAAGWPADQRRIEIASATFLYWWCDERSPWAAMMEVLASEGPGAAIYIDPETNIFHFEGRNYRTTAARATTSQATFYGEQVSGLFYTALSYEPGFDQIVNKATVLTRRRTVGALQQVWQYGQTLVIPAGETRTLIARPSTPFKDPVVPVEGTDFTVTAGSVSTIIESSSGFSAIIVFGAGVGGATLDNIQLRAYPLTVASETTVPNSVDASASIATFGEQTYQVPGWPEIETAEAEAVANTWVTRYQEQRASVSITLRNADDAHVEQMLQRQVGDRITIVDANTGLNNDVWIETKRLEMSGPGGVVLSCVFGCETATSLTGAIWDTSEWNDATAVWGV